MDYETVSEGIRARMESFERRGKLPPFRPNVEDLWLMLDGDGPMVLLVTLDYMHARAQHLDALAARDLVTV